MGQARDAAFLRFVVAWRGPLLGAAVLLGATPAEAERLVRWALASTYARREREPEISAAGLVLTTEPVAVSWPEGGPRVQLLDETPVPATALPAPLRRLTRRQRSVLVGSHYLGLSTEQLSQALGLDPGAVQAQYAEAVCAFGGHNIAPRLAAVAGPPVSDPTGSAALADLAAGHRLWRRRRAPRLLAAAAAVLLVAVLAMQLRPAPSSTSAPVPGPAAPIGAPTPIASAQVGGVSGCDRRQPACRVQVTRAWRAGVTAAATTDLDPEGHYFTGGFSYGYDDRYDSDAWWRGGDGALGLDLLSRDGSSTQVFLQVASSRKTAVRCGALTGHICRRQQFMDLNWFTLTQSVDAAHGVEVQYRPDGDQVITAVARDVGHGRTLPITRGDLLTLVQDPRLRLPSR